MKIGIKKHLGMGELIRSHAKIFVKTMCGDLLVRSFMSNFAFRIRKTSKTNKKTSKNETI